MAGGLIKFSNGGTLTYGSPGLDIGAASVAPPSGTPVLGQYTVLNPGQYKVVNLSMAPLWVAFSDGAGGTPSYLPLAASPDGVKPGGDTSTEMWWFTGQIEVMGPTGSAFFGRAN
jgi:hypothetical protein